MKRQHVPVMYLCVRESLGMTGGKLSAQVGHGVSGILSELRKLEWKYFKGENSLEEIFREAGKDREIMLEWLETENWTKVTLGVDENKWEDIKKLPNSFVVVDGGFTELPPNTETVVAFWPMIKSSAPQLIKDLKPLKA